MDFDGLRLGIPVWHLSFATPRWMRSFINRVIGIWGTFATNVFFFCFFACLKNLQVMMIHLKKKMCIRSGIFFGEDHIQTFPHHFKPERLLYASMMQQFSILTPQDSLNCNLLEAFLEIHQAKGENLEVTGLPFCQEMVHEKPSFFVERNCHWMMRGGYLHILFETRTCNSGSENPRVISARYLRSVVDPL